MIRRLLGRSNWESGIAVMEDNVLGNRVMAFRFPIEEDSVKEGADSMISFSLPVKYRKKSGSVLRNIDSHIEASRNGVRLAVNKPLAVGTRIELNLKLPKIHHSMHLIGVVVWLQSSLNHLASYECGVVFDNLRKVSHKDKLIGLFADRLCHYAIQKTKNFICRPAESWYEISQAFRLIYRQYLMRGYCRPNPTEMHYNYFCMLPQSRAFIVESDKKILGTISLIPDSPCGLPMESLFPMEISKLRAPGRKLAEVGFLALDLDRFGKKRFSLTDFRKLSCTFQLFKIMFDYARQMGVTDLVIAMHPKHKELYEYLTFETLGPVKSYEGACGNPALPMRMNIPQAEEHTATHHGKGMYFLKDRIPKEILSRHFCWTAQDIYDLTLKFQPLWEDIPQNAKDYLKFCYPSLQFSNALSTEPHKESSFQNF
ncbi:MAG: hypothetical protein HYZ85_05625 [Candidatus Omnitrophica bacterium]|nr:hypothetical protein [Candidatus Omnitrophota bacterium]